MTCLPESIFTGLSAPCRPICFSYPRPPFNSDSVLFLNGATTPVGDGTCYCFQYGPDTTYGSFTITNCLDTDTNPASLSIPLSPAFAATMHHCQLLVWDDYSIQHGGDVTYNTQPIPYILSVTNINTNSAAVYAEAKANGSPTWAWLFYYTDNSFQSFTASQFVGSDPSNWASFEQALHQLLPGTTYHVQGVASNSYGAVYGNVRTFQTAYGP